MDFKNYLEEAAKKLDLEVGRIIKGQLEEARRTDRKLVPLLEAFAKSCQGGKRIRGSLVVLGYRIAAHLPGVKAHLEGEIIRVGAAYEIVHTAILVHDDIIDESLTRRGQPSLYAVLGRGHYGVSQAISLGDYGFFLAFNSISETDFPPDCKIQALKLFSKVMADTTWGEMLDLEKTDPLTVMKLKTACYTVSGPLQVGALLGGANEKLIGVLGEFGESLGIAFQIRDDILDGEAFGGKDHVEKKAERYKSEALKVLPDITKDLKMSKLLEQMAAYLVERNK